MSALHDTAARLLRLLPPETAHAASVRAIALGLGPRAAGDDDPILAVTIAGLALPNPIGLAAGYDKNAHVPDALLAMGFGFVECGAVTPRAQSGNPKPRLFRLTPDRAVINRMGFNNDGLDAFAARLRARAGRPGIVGVNLGANKDSDDRASDYAAGLTALSGLASFFTVNISSPNTPGLRALQSRDALDDLLARVDAARGAEPVFLKVAPDLSGADIAVIAEAASAHRIDGLIVSNTTIERPADLRSPDRAETGGLSGRPLFERSTAILRDFRAALPAAMPIIGVGGVESVETAWAKIRAGASAVQLYTALVYEGPDLVARIKRGLAGKLRAEGFASVSEAVGAA